MASEILKIDLLSVRGVPEWHSNTLEVKSACLEAAGIAERLGQRISGTKRYLLCLDDGERVALADKRVIGWAGFGGKFFDCGRPVSS